MNNDELSRRLTERVSDVTATPDLGAVLHGADRRRRRTRAAGLGGAAAVVVLGIGGFIALADPDAEGDVASSPIVTEAPPEVPNDGQLDPADPFLDETTELYRRYMPSGYDLHIRMSDVPYGELFGVEWALPTGSTDECLGAPAVFIGDPAGPSRGDSNWSVRQWGDFTDEQPTIVEETYTDATSNLIIRTSLPAREIGIEQGGEILDSAPFENGIAVIEMLPFGAGQFPGDDDGPMLSMAIEQADGSLDVEVFPVYSSRYGEPSASAGCFAPRKPGASLPEPGEQPADPAAAEQLIRERHALLVDLSVPTEERPGDLLINDAGVAEARTQMEVGEFADSVGSAEYRIGDLVFVDPTTAWFGYGIFTPTETFGPRFGTAVFNGEVWQFSRQTICQDLALGGGQCDGPGTETPHVATPIPEGADLAQMQSAWAELADRYMEARICNPLQPCGDFEHESDE